MSELPCILSNGRHYDEVIPFGKRATTYLDNSELHSAVRRSLEEASCGKRQQRAVVNPVRGPDMAQRQDDQLRSGVHETCSKRSQRIGILDTVHRLRTYYGERGQQE
eukprot:jgi/Botrbrau1/17012/Bobra.49_2s0070.1